MTDAPSTLPAIELRSIKVDHRASEETYAYSAKLFVDGEHLCDVGNDGRGGCDRYLGPGKKLEYGDAMRRYDALCKLVAERFPQQDLAEPGEAPRMVEDSLEYLCSRLVSDDILGKQMARDLKRHVLFFREGLPAAGTKASLRMIRSDGGEAAVIARVRSTYPSAYVLNEQDQPTALAAYGMAE